MPAERIAIDLGHWQNKKPEVIIQDTASFVIEASKRPLEKRINAGVVKVTEFGNLVKRESLNPEDTATWRIFEWAREDSSSLIIRTKSSSPEEEEILKTMQDYLDINPQTMVLWISPSLKGHYQESRIVVYQTIEANHEKYLFFRTICGQQSETECLNIAKKLLASSDQTLKTPNSITNVDQLRSTPLLFLIKGKESWINYLSRFIDMPAVWKAIAEGEDLRAKKEALVVAQQVITENYQGIIGSHYSGQLAVGVKIERDLQEKMGIILQSGPCGMLYSDLNRQGWATIVPLDIENFSYSEEETKFIKNCGACGKELNRYMAKGDRCPYCNGIYEGC